MQDSPIGHLSNIPSFGAATLEGGFDLNDIQEGKPLRGKSNRQFVRFFNQTFSQVYTSEVKVNERTGECRPVKTATRPVTVEMVEIVTPGDTNVICDKAQHYHKRQFYKHYKDFRDGKTAPVGQSVEDCSFISPHIALELKYLGCHTVEQLADASDILCGNLADGFELREFARAHCKAKIENKDNPQINILRGELEKSQALIAEMQEQLKELKATKNVRKKEIEA